MNIFIAPRGKVHFIHHTHIVVAAVVVLKSRLNAYAEPGEKRHLRG